MRHLCVTFLLALLVAAVATLPIPRQGQLAEPVQSQGQEQPTEYYNVRNLPPQIKQMVVKKLEDDIVRAARVGAAAQAIRIEQQLEDEILATAVKKLVAHRGDKAQQAEDLIELEDLVRRDKRAVESISASLTASAGTTSGTSDTSATTSGTSGDGDSNEDTDDSGGSNVLGLLSGVLGSLSSGGSGGGGAEGEDGGGGSNILSLITTLLGSSSGGGGGAEVGVSASGGTGKDPLQGGTYDDLIGKGPFTFFGNGMSQLLQFKFTIFRTLFSIVTQLLTSSSSSKFASFSAGGHTS